MKLKVIKKQNNSKDCIICGIENKLGLQVGFYEVENNILISPFIARNEHQSYPGRMHGGMISAILDEAAGRAIQITEPDTWGVTGTLEIKFKKPVPLDTQLYCCTKIIKNSSRVFVGTGFIEDLQGNVLAVATGTFVKSPVEVIANNNSEHLGWMQVAFKNEPTEFDIKNLHLLEPAE